MSKNSFNGSTVKEIESIEKIDRWKTFEIFFNLKNNEDCIRINIISEIYDEIISKNIPINTYFIVEKAIDISKFASGSNILYSEIGRNYDYSWNTKQEIDICSSESDPIKRLNKDDKFRIRFTAFRDKNFQFKINISSKYSINITEKNPDLK